MFNEAKYTVLLKRIMNSPEGAEALKKAMATYPLYEKKSKEEFCPSYIPTREELNKKILNFYKYKEIGFETVGRFLEELETSLCEIMPYYNQLFFSADQDYNILFNVDYQRTIDTTRQGENSNTATSQSDGTDATTSNITATDTNSTQSTTDTNSKMVKSQTPQGQLSITASNIDTVSYADDVTWNKDHATSSANSQGTNESDSTTNTTTANTTTAQSNGTDSQSEQTLETTKGNFGVMATQDLITKYRDLIINIEQQIINDVRIKELFMNLY